VFVRDVVIGVLDVVMMDGKRQVSSGEFHIVLYSKASPGSGRISLLGFRLPASRDSLSATWAESTWQALTGRASPSQSPLLHESRESRRIQKTQSRENPKSG
jgi:hypothetical protein